jgi:hypothetical protein
VRPRHSLIEVAAQADKRRGLWAFGLTVTAFVWALGLVAAAFVAPVYIGESHTVSGGVASTVSTTSTLVDENGLGVLIPVALPAALTALVWLALQQKCSRGSRRSSEAAWWLVGLVAMFSLLSGFTIGMFVAPVALLLAGAASLTPRGAPPVRSSRRTLGTR